MCSSFASKVNTFPCLIFSVSYAFKSSASSMHLHIEISCCNIVKITFILFLQIFQGNQNTYMAELREVKPPIIARRLRFVPFSSHPKTVCMRVELYGCTWPGNNPKFYNCNGANSNLGRRGNGTANCLKNTCSF